VTTIQADFDSAVARNPQKVHMSPAVHDSDVLDNAESRELLSLIFGFLEDLR
jgi:hypothetical protein